MVSEGRTNLKNRSIKLVFSIYGPTSLAGQIEHFANFFKKIASKWRTVYSQNVFTYFPTPISLEIRDYSYSVISSGCSTKPTNYLVYRFLLMVRKGYRNPAYHNWIHAFTVAHFCFLLYKNAKISSHLR